MKKGFSVFLALALLLLGLGVALADPDLTLRDSDVRSGPWPEAYTQILQERSEGIRAYEDYVISITYREQCHPVGLTDLTGDGVPELIFLDLFDNTEYGFKVGRLWIYTSDGSGVHCALSLVPEIDDMLYSTVFLAEDGLLTVHLSDTEKGFTLQFRLGRDGHYTAETILIAEEDFSGEGPDAYYLNGSKISAKTYSSKIKKIQSARGTQIGSLNVDDGYCGFAFTLEEALKELSAAEVAETPQPTAGNGEAQHQSGNQSQNTGRFPELSFTLGTFTPGQKFAVYSAPSARAFRSAKGKAAITSGSEIFVAGTDGNWILIHYELENGLNRVGYINAEKITGSYSAGSVLSFANTQMTLVQGATLTDDPVHQQSTIGKLKKGAKVTCLAEYEGWIYVEAKVSGKTARGFLPPSALGLE